MKKLRLAINIGFGILIGMTFPEQINEAYMFLKGVDYAGLFESLKMFLMKAIELGKDAVNAIIGLFDGASEASA